ncbi:MAG: O-antigen ligase family protein [Chloroflexi bacterium]|nr:O-antigen ligase family protein [Chloroflexota bacterium]
MKNFSSPESILYLNDALIVNPLEVYIVAMFVSWLGSGLMRRKVRFYTSELFWPAIAFLFFVVVGLFYGIFTRGNLNMSLWETRPMFYLVAMIILTSNLLDKREHFSHLMWAAVAALSIESIYGVYHFLVNLDGTLANVSAITEHSAAIHLNTLFVLFVTLWLYEGSAIKRFGMIPVIPFALLTYLAMQRRAAFITLFVGLFFIAILLFIDKRHVFWLVMPPAAIVGLLYVAVFWNASGTLGLPAQAIKSVVAEDQADASDVSSNLYRQIENVNISFTIHQRPLTGVGFGQPFYILVPLPDISFFEWWSYLPHNSVVYIWVKAGVGGFLSMLFFVGTAILVGTQAIRRMPHNELRAFAATATIYMAMHFIFAYVDISWDAPSTLYLGAMMGMVSCMERVVGQSTAVKKPRWPWQPEPHPAPGLL